ncbi:MAG: hypothetical protein ABRQ37_04950 [Candidatus Eremiobacterota bacterium]
MQIGTNYNVASAQPKFTPKAKEAGSGDQVVIGENVTDSTISMGEQLKNMKAHSEGEVIEAVGKAGCLVLNDIFSTGVGGVLGSVGGSIGAGVVASIAHTGVFGTIGLIAGGVVGGALVGGTIGHKIAEHEANK